MNGLAALIDESVDDVTESLSREADATDNDVRWPHGEVILVSNNRRDPWNTDVVGYTTDSDGNRTGRIIEHLFRGEFQLNVWIAAPSDFDVKELGNQLEQHVISHDESHPDPAAVPDGVGGTLDDVKLRLINGGELPTESANPPHRGYQVTVSTQFSYTTETDEEPITSIDITQTTTNDSGVEIEFIA